MTVLYLVRHGNARRQRGWTYVTAPLTALGRKQAELTGDYFERAQVHFDALYSSRLKRALETATIIGQRIQLEPQVMPGLEEIAYREVPATIAAELLARTGVLNRYFEGRIGKPIRYPMIGRVARVVLELVAEHPDGTLCAVTHGGVVSSSLSWFFPRERQRWWRETVGNCSITRLNIEQGRAELGAWNEASHLGALKTTTEESLSGDDPRRAQVQSSK